MKTKYTIMATLLLLGLGATSCKKKGCTDPPALNYNAEAEKDDGSCTYAETKTVKFSFTHNFDGTGLTAAGFDQLNYTNASGNVLSFTKLQYSISDVRFYKANGDSIYLDGYHFVDLTDNATLEYTLPATIEVGDYTGIAFNWGFNEADNVSGAYADLNALSWSWPDMIGGGYHQLKMEGRYINAATDTISYQYHAGSRVRQISGIDTTFHLNYAHIELPSSAFTLSNNATIEVKMNLAEWFKNPNTWDLNTYFSMLMPNYTAQVMMNQNSSTVFSLGTITQ